MQRRAWATVWSLVAANLILTLAACTSSDVDPRCTIDAPNQSYRGKLAQSFNGSKLWQAYLEVVQPSREGATPVVAIDLDMERKVTDRSSDGDYDPGVVAVRFTITSLPRDSILYEREERIGLDPIIFGSFDRDATRDEIQQKAFEYTETKLFPYLVRWVDIAALRAMGEEGSEAFIPVLEAQAQDPTAEDLSMQAQLALKKIKR